LITGKISLQVCRSQNDVPVNRVYRHADSAEPTRPMPIHLHIIELQYYARRIRQYFTLGLNNIGALSIFTSSLRLSIWCLVILLSEQLVSNFLLINLAVCLLLMRITLLLLVLKIVAP
jgi:hypothetical protein